MTSEPTRRRGAAPRGRPALLLVVALAVAGITVIAVALRGEDEDGRAETPASAAAPTTTALGLTFRLPAGWRLTRSGTETIALTSSDRAVRVAIAAEPATRAEAVAMRVEGERVLLRTYAPAKVVAREPGLFADHRVATTEIVGRNPRSGAGMRVLALAASGPRDVYAVQVFSAARPPALRIAEARRLLDTVRFAR